MIKKKIGKCCDCPASARETALIAGRCQLHYWQHRNKQSKSKKQNIAKSMERKDNDIFFASQILQIPDKCENCGNRFYFTESWQRRAAIAHILPKATVKSVRTHPMNRWFGCIDCHTNYDNKGEEYVVQMKVFPLLVERLKEFYPLIDPKERRRIPEYFIKALNHKNATGD